MKKIIALTVILCLALSGCGEEKSLKEELPQGTPPVVTETAAPEAAVLYDDSLLGEISVQGQCLDDQGESIFPFSYKVPQLLDDSTDATMFNRQLAQLCEDAESGFAIPYESIRWSHHWNGSLVSLCVEFRVPFAGIVDYLTYNYDFAQGKSLSNEELLTSQGYSPEETDLALRRAAARISDGQTAAGYQNQSDALEGLLELRCQTLSVGNLSIYNSPLYLDGQGNLRCYACIGVPAGGGWYVEDLLVEPLPAHDAVKKADCDFMTAELKNNAVTLTFRNESLAGLFTNPDALEYDVPYPVEGLYGDYTDVALGFVGNGGYAYLVLLDAEGRVTFCNVMNGLNVGCRFFAIGPLPQLTDIVGFELSQDEGGSSIAAVSADGRSTDLFELLTEMESVLPRPLRDCSWSTSDGVYSLNIQGEGLTTYGGGGGMLGVGYSLQYLGMNEEGMQFYFPMTMEESDFVCGILTLSPLTSLSSGNSGYRVTMTQTFGPPMSGFQNGSLTLFQNF